MHYIRIHRKNVNFISQIKLVDELSPYFLLFPLFMIFTENAPLRIQLPTRLAKLEARLFGK